MYSPLYVLYDIINGLVCKIIIHVCSKVQQKSKNLKI